MKGIFKTLGTALQCVAFFAGSLLLSQIAYSHYLTTSQTIWNYLWLLCACWFVGCLAGEMCITSIKRLNIWLDTEIARLREAKNRLQAEIDKRDEILRHMR